MKTSILFPGLFPDKMIEIDRVAFSLGNLTVYWYGIILSCGIIAAFIYFLSRGKKSEGLLEDDILNTSLLAIPFAIIGARFFYVITNLSEYTTFTDVFKIWKGGIAIYGAIIFGALAVVIYAKIKKISALKIYDAISPAVMLGQIIGRWGNFVNGEAYGYSSNIANFPWRMEVNGVLAHPTFLYESLWNLIGFIIINIVYKKKKFDGQIFCIYAGWYGLGRGFIEFLRTDSCYLFGQKIFVYIGLLSFVLSIIFYIVLTKKHARELVELAEYRKLYGEPENDILVDGGEDMSGDDTQKSDAVGNESETNSDKDSGNEDNEEGENKDDGENN